MVIFGGAGDLTKRKRMPAPCNLAEQDFVPPQFAVVIVSSGAFTTDAFRQQLSEDIKTFASRAINLTIRERLVEHTYYVRGDFADPDVYHDQSHWGTRGLRFADITQSS
jgi:glucose-6-phosphate 1-dehydrogenase